MKLDVQISPLLIDCEHLQRSVKIGQKYIFSLIYKYQVTSYLLNILPFFKLLLIYFFQVIPTELRANPLYYRVYYVHLNTIFASIIPLISLVNILQQTVFSRPVGPDSLDAKMRKSCSIVIIVFYDLSFWI